MAKLMIKNIGTLVSGNISNPLLDADAIIIGGGLIEAVGKEKSFDTKGVDQVMDIGGMTITPGLIDSHCHPVFGDFTPRQKMMDFIESSLHGGVTTVISAGEVHLVGRPKDVAGTKALAILAAKSFASARPAGVKVLGGGLILEPGLQEKDFEELAKEGVKVVGEIGLGGVKSPKDAAPMVKWAKKYGMVVMMHTGGTSIPGSATVPADDVITAGADIVSHINGGPTAISITEAEKLIRKTSLILEIVHCGNSKMIVDVMEIVKEVKAYSRIIIGNDAPSGTGVIPLGILRVINFLASLCGVKAEEAIAMATGNTARVYKLNRGVVEVGKEADLVIMDAPMGSVGKDALSAIEAGDIPGIAGVMIDGVTRVGVSRNTPPPNRKTVSGKA
ncbi:MAG TPA: amidohydrolase family protein [Thermodesulfobacteriota bacterium]|nr:amidohydrolase family protein [Thermodesulfobacteriota bacterium]